MLRLLGLDFDGTLIENRVSGPIVSPRTLARLHALVDRGVVAGIVTGNAWWTTRLRLALAGANWSDPFPSFVVSREAFIHWKTAGGAMDPDTEWNEARSSNLGRLVSWLGALHYELYAEMTATGLRPVHFHLLGDYGLEAHFDTEEEAEEARTWLEERLRDRPLVRIHRNRTNANVVPSTAGKGASLLRIAQSRGIDPCDVLAVGDALNDADMLDGNLGMRCATTGNAVARIKEIVRAAGGFIANGHSTWGLEEILEHALSGG